MAGSNVTLTPDTTSKSVTISATGGGGGGTSDYLQLSNKPKINGIELVDNTTTEDLGIVVPQYTSELENDSGFITNEADPTVPAWAKEPTKPTYTAEEVGALPSNTPIPDPTSVVVDRFVSVGTHIADISVNGEKTELYAPTGGGGTSVTVDSELSTTSENPVQNKVITQALNGKGTYSKPTGGIPKTDLASEVQTSLGKADTALQEHQDISGKANKADLTALSNTISDAWNASTTYAVGQYCIYNNSLWKCLVQHSGQTPTEGTYWTKVTVANEITSVNNSLKWWIDNGYLPEPNKQIIALVPAMTSNTTPSGKCIASADSTNAYKAFNQNASDFWGSGVSSSASIGYMFSSKTKVKYIEITNRSDSGITSPKNLIVQGSDDGTNWNDIVNYTNSNTTNGDKWKINVNANTAYKYWRLNITSLNSQYLNIAEIQLYGYTQ